MSNEQARILLERGIQAAKAGDKDQARKLIQQSLRLDQYNDSAWLFLASVARNKRERLLSLKRTLEINPRNEMAIKAVEALGIDPAQLIPKAQTIEQSLAEADATVQRGDVPLPDAGAIDELRQMAEEIAQEYLASSTMTQNINWVKKQKRRAGEREITILRLQILSAITVFVAVVFGVMAVLVSNSPSAQRVLFGASATPIPPTRTPIPSFTPTLGITPTPSPTTDFTQEPTPSSTPTINPFILRGPRELTPTPTQVEYFQQPDNRILDAIGLLAAGEPETVPTLMVVSRRQQGSNFNPNPYYYEALAYAEMGNYDAALNILTEAETTIEGGVPGNTVIFMSQINLGFAQVYLMQAQAEAEQGNTGALDPILENLRTRADQSLDFTFDRPEAYITKSRSYILEDDYEEAAEILIEARTLERSDQQPNLRDLNLILELAETYMQEAEFHRSRGDEAGARDALSKAAYQAFFALYLTPYIERAHEIQVEAAMANEDYGLAVIRSQEYLNFFPNSANARRLLGEARIAEGNINLALEAYAQGLEADSTDAEKAELYVARAELFSEQGRYDQALVDLNAAFELVEDDSIRAARMRVAYAAGDYATAGEDADALLDSPLVAADEVRLIQARILVDEASEDGDYTRALTLLNNIGSGLSDILRGDTEEYRARAEFALGRAEAALPAVESAIALQETGSRRFLRGQINEELQNFAPAIADYEWVLTWSPVYNYPFTTSAREGLVRIRETIAELERQATATAAAATAAAEQVTETFIAEQTATAETATAIFFATNPPTATNTDTPAPTNTPTATDTPPPTSTAVDTDEPTPTREGGG